MTEIPHLALNNNVKIPQLGLGVYQTKEGVETENAVKYALEAGYRLIDTARLYHNEENVGNAIHASSIPRDEIFVTTKLWNSDQGRDNTLRAFDESLERLKMDYIDLYLIHWPVPGYDKYIETWKAFEEIYKSGRAKAIGVSNFHIPHLERLLNETNIVPAVNQVELHPRLAQKELRHYCESKNIKVESWGPIGGSGGDLLDDPTIRDIAQKHGKSPAQIVLRWHVQQGLIVIPKSTQAERIQQNADVFDFTLDESDMANLDTLDTGDRHGPDPNTMNVH